MANVQAFLQILSDLADQANGYRKIAFQQAYSILKNTKKETITLEDAEKLKSFGTGILKRLEEFIKTGKLEELKDSPSSIIKKFEGIYGIGPVTAKKWVELGFKDLKDIPRESLTEAQKLGLLYYDDINSKIPRKEIDQIQSILDQRVKQFNTDNKSQIKYQICGSYLRGREESGDIDIILTESKGNLNKVIESFLIAINGIVEHILASGDAKILCLGGLKGGKRRRIDFELVEPNEWAFALMYFTGSKNFNKYIRGIAKENGYTLNQKGLTNGTFDVHADKEEDIFDFLGLAYISPKDRDSY